MTSVPTCLTLQRLQGLFYLHIGHGTMISTILSFDRSIVCILWIYYFPNLVLHYKRLTPIWQPFLYSFWITSLPLMTSSDGCLLNIYNSYFHCDSSTYHSSEYNSYFHLIRVNYTYLLLRIPPSWYRLVVKQESKRRVSKRIQKHQLGPSNLHLIQALFQPLRGILTKEKISHFLLLHRENPPLSLMASKLSMRLLAESNSVSMASSMSYRKGR